MFLSPVWFYSLNENSEKSYAFTDLVCFCGSYIDPQYFLRRQLTPASDVYSYGVVLLELVTGQKAIRKNEQGDELNLIQWATPRLEEGGIEAIVDAQLEGNYPQDIYLDMAQLAVRCAAFEKDFRPSMKVAH
jgi:serine/threonine protein kinase